MKTVELANPDDTCTRGWYGLLLLGVVIGCYAPVFAYPHIQDDWRLLSYLRSGPSADEVARLVFDPSGALFFRPLSRLYHIASHAVFGLHAWGFHALALLWLWGGAWLVARVARIVTGDAPTAAATGLLYAAATSVHMDSMLWEAGVNELAGAFFAWLSMLLFLRARPARAAAAWFAALLFKEAAVFVPALLLLARALRIAPPSPPASGARGLVRAFAPFALVLVLYAVPKALNVNAARLPDDHPYRVAFGAAPLAANVASYGKWTLDALFPCAAQTERAEPLLRGAAGKSVVTLVLVAGLATLLLAPDGAAVHRRNAFLAAWIVLGLAPVLFLPNHAYRYYLTYSLPPILALFLLGARGLFSLLGAKVSLLALLLVVAGNVFFSARSFWLRNAEGLSARFTDGTNHLIARGQTVNLVRDGLRTMHPTLPRGSVLIFDGVVLESFDWDSGPRVWYGDQTLVVLPLAHVRRHRVGTTVETLDRGRLQRMGSSGQTTVELRPGATFAFRLQGGRLVEFTDEFFGSLGT